MNGSLLPFGYEKLEYLQSDGTAYITTDIVPSDEGDIIEAKASLVLENSTMVIVGASNPQSSVFNAFGRTTIGGNKFFLQIGGGTSYKLLSTESDENVHIHYADIKNKTYHIDNDPEIILTFNYGRSLYPYGIFYQSSTTSYPAYMKGKIYYVKIKGRAMYIPALRKSDNKPGLYDTIGKKFFTSAGSGEFTYA